jgi:hypothetical protein
MDNVALIRIEKPALLRLKKIPKKWKKAVARAAILLDRTRSLCGKPTPSPFV